MTDFRPEPPLTRVPRWLRRTGRSAWLSLGIIAFAVVVYLGLAQISALLIPLVVSVVLAMIFHPIVDVMERAKIPRALGAAAVLIGLASIVVAAVWLAVLGVIDQSELIVTQVENGWERIQLWLTDFGVSLDGLQNVWSAVSGGAASGVSGLVKTGFSSAAAFAIGTFIAAFLLYYLLKDWHPIRRWVAGHSALPLDLSVGLVEDATTAIRRYFYGLTLASIPVALGIGLAMWILGLPLVATVILVTFITSYIPYLGAIFSGALTVLIALGAGGMTDALIMLVVVLITQNAIQTLVQTKLTSDQLSLHPIVNLGSTIVGASVAGLLGATLSAPIVATLIAARQRIHEYYSGQSSDAAPDGEPRLNPPQSTGGLKQ